MLPPGKINLRDNFVGSKWENTETEIVAHNIVFTQKERNPDNWTPFTWEEYRTRCNHDVTHSELEVLEALVNGGFPIIRTTACIKGGYLTKDDNGFYSVTEVFIDALPERVKLL